MKEDFYESQREEISSDGIFGLVFKDTSIKSKLVEFSTENLGKITAFEKEKGRFYVRCLKRNKDIFVYDKNKNIGKVEKSVQFGKRSQRKSC